MEDLKQFREYFEKTLDRRDQRELEQQKVIHELKWEINHLKQNRPDEKIDEFQRTISTMSTGIATILKDIEYIKEAQKQNEKNIDKANSKYEAFFDKYVTKLSVPIGLLFLALKELFK